MAAPPEDRRIDPHPVGDERTTLTAFLRFHRDTLEYKCAGLDVEELARRPVEPSTLSLLGLVRHLAEVERIWFRRVLAGRDDPPHFFPIDDPDVVFDAVTADPAMLDEAWAVWREEVAFAERFVDDAPNLDVTGEHPRLGPVSLRWILVHMVEEYSRHNGHADLLRQRIDGAVGE